MESQIVVLKMQGNKIILTHVWPGAMVSHEQYRFKIRTCMECS